MSEQHQSDAYDAAQPLSQADFDGALIYFACQRCDGHGAVVCRNDDGSKRAELCTHCGGDGRLGTTRDQVEDARAVGSDNPFCRHDWSYSDDDRCYCSLCGADGDA